jgi:hypothetical protein
MHRGFAFLSLSLSLALARAPSLYVRLRPHTLSLVPSARIFQTRV